ncbi:hypothetical protein MCEJIRE27_00157 [Candidatus Nanopelagicaceae bacterium]
MIRHKTSRKFLVLAAAMVPFLTSCGSSTEAQPDSIAYDIELWSPYFTKTSDNHCTGTDDNYENNSPITLVGPDGSEISTATFSFGVLATTTEPEDQVTNFPTARICRFEVEFPNIPDVATYRVKTRDGQISPVSFSRADVISRGWGMSEIIGADFKK